MNKEPNLDWGQLHNLFSIVLCINEDFEIVYASDTLSKYVPDAVSGRRLDRVFDISRPSSVSSYSDALGNLDSLYLMTSVDRSFAIRGQLARIDYFGNEALCLFGSPWLFWINSNCPHIRLKLDDFSPQDVQLDQLFFMSSEKTMLEDLEKLNEELKEARLGVEEAKATEAKLFAQMSHEMRTPLNGVVSALTLLQNQDLPDSASRLVELARGASNNLMQVSNFVLDVAKLEDGKAEKTPFLLADCLQSALAIVEPRAEEKSIEVRLELADNLAHGYLADKSKLSQSILNLLTNAVKFTDEGSVTLAVTTEAGDGTQPALRFEVIDTGLGIVPENLDKVFDPFWSNSRLNRGQRDLGTGLGLDIVRRNIEIMGGDMGVDSTPGEGSRFWFRIPMTPTEVATTVDKTEANTSQGLTGKVLLVDDNDTNLTLGKMLLESVGAEVTEANSGAKAVAEAQTGSYDLVLMDINMPEMDGLEATRSIRQFADNDALPIVAMTAYSTEDERSAGFESGMDGYIVKPIELDLLVEQLSRWLPTLADSADNELIDQGVLDHLRGQIGEDNLTSVLLKFQLEALSRLDNLQTAASGRDLSGVLRESHTLASTCESFGLQEASGVLREIEALAKAGEIANNVVLLEARKIVLISLAELPG